ncbi:hypothetical protein [uncultured Subdoligranulum sp.]|nr:hypothetical protein [uncultured Subdoligranulum sp.]
MAAGAAAVPAGADRVLRFATDVNYQNFWPFSLNKYANVATLDLRKKAP